MMTSAVQEPINLDETSEMNGSGTDSISYMQSFNNVAMRHIFSYLNTKDLAVASRVCTSWNMVSKDKVFWRFVQLEETRIYDWEKFIDNINRNGTIILNTEGMTLPSEVHDIQNFWTNFITAIKRATQLHQLDLYTCPINVVQECIIALPQLSVFNASSIRYPNETEDTIGINELKPINLSFVNRMANLTKIKLKALSGIKIEATPTLLTFENLTKLRTLSLTSIKLFPLNICRSLDTVTTSLEYLEIGDCNIIANDLPTSIKRFINLKSLRLENCYNREKEFTIELLVAIRSLKKLKCLELVNIEVDNSVKEELKNCTSLDYLVIIPWYVDRYASTNRYLIECIENLSNTLKHVVWGLTYELLHVTDLFINQNLQILHILGKKTDISLERIPFNYVPILNKAAQLDNISERDVDIHTISSFEDLVKLTLPNGETTVIKVSFEETTQVYIRKYLKEIK